MSQNLLDLAAVAERLGCTERTARRLMVARILPVVRIGRLTRVRPADLEAYIERNVEGIRRKDPRRA